MIVFLTDGIFVLDYLSKTEGKIYGIFSRYFDDVRMMACAAVGRVHLNIFLIIFL